MERRSLPALVIAALVALIGGYIAIRSLAAALTALPAGAAVERLRAGEAVEYDLVVEAATRSRQASAMFEASRYNSDALLALGRLRADDRSRILAGATMRGVVEGALSDAPASPHNWARRAQLQLGAGDIAGARGSLETSLLLGRVVPGLTIPRLAIIDALLRKSADAELDRSFDEQVRVAARTEPAALAALADGGRIEGRVQRLLAPDFELYNPYLKALIYLRVLKARSEKQS